MRKSVKVRKVIYEILNNIYSKSLNYEESFAYFSNKILLTEQERSMIYNVTLNSMRLSYYINSTLKEYLKKKTKIEIKILLISAITQITYLDFKAYAVTNDTVEVAKIKNLNPGLINSLLKNIITNSESISNRNLDQKSIPAWFLEHLKKNNKISLKNFIRTISKEPSIHLVFKNKKNLLDFNETYLKTTEKSAFISEKCRITEMDGYSKGDWWVQDFSSMLPIYLSPEIKLKNTIDLCSAPGGKAFQAISLGSEITLNDKSLKRINILKQNLKRLSFNSKVLNYDVMKIPEQRKYDVVILDSPCSGIGTVRRNPEIFFKKRSPNFIELSILQNSLISKAAKLLTTNGILIYMVCSFLYEETKEIKNKFLLQNKNFSQNKFKSNREIKLKKFIDSDGDILCTPSEYNGYMIDGFYAVKFIKND